jgi:dienelactone hydrolase
LLRRIIILVLALTVVFAAVSPVAHAAASALLLLPEFFPNAPARPLEWVTRAPTKTTVQLPYAGRTAVADLYDPGTAGSHGGVVIFLGVNQAGRDDPRVVRLGESLARIGLVTLVPESQDLLNDRVDPGEVDEVVAGFQYLAARPDVDPRRVGIGGLCIGASLSLVAAEDPRINGRVALVNSFAGYFDLRSYAVSILTHSFEPDPPEPGGARVPWEPAPIATTVLADHLVSLDADPAEQQLLRAAVHDPQAPRPSPDRLTPVGRTVWSLLNTKDPATAERLLGELPPDAQQTLDYLSPDTHLDRLQAQTFIMHDRNDSTVPYVQSRLLAAHLRPGQGEYDEFDLFNHVDPTAPVSLPIFVRDTARLGWHMYQIVAILQGAVPVQRF